MAIALAACSDPSGATSAGDVTGDADDIVEKDATVRPDVPKPFPDVVVVTECTGDDECDDGLFCNGMETCRPTAIGAAPNGCLAGELPRPDDADLGDCVVFGACDEETGGFPTVTLKQGDLCDDGIACTVSDTCVDGERCEGTLDDSRCDDGAFCNGVETCTRTIGCVAGTPPVAIDLDSGDCLVPGPCDETTDSHPLIPAPLAQPCNDGVACTKSDGCTSAGTCAGTPNDEACSDGVFCNGAEVCSAKDGCGSGIAAPPADSSPDDCLEPGPCDEVAKTYPLVARAAGAICNDGVACTTADACAGTVCAGTPDASLCDDGLFCNGPESCGVAGCEAGLVPVPLDPDPNDCLVPTGGCSEALGSYELEPTAMATLCDDAVDCTTDDQCDADGACAGAPSNPHCDDNLFCNGAEFCTSAGCQPGTPPLPPSDMNPNDCYLAGTACDEASDNFPQVQRPATSTCDDADLCTLGDVCAANGTCAGLHSGTLCSSGVCESGVCQEPTCFDGVLNGIECGVDCGHGCKGCANGIICDFPTDCESGYCDGVCATPPCENGVKDGAETAIDCGGTCGGCGEGIACNVNADCLSGLTCTGLVCSL